MRKVAPVDSLEGLSIETVILAPLALGWVIWLNQQGEGGFGQFGIGIDALLILGGSGHRDPIAAVHRGGAAAALFDALGFLQYIAPSLQFLLAVLAFGEALTRTHIICFGAIWSALAIFTFEGLRQGAPPRARAEAECCTP